MRSHGAAVVAQEDPGLDDTMIGLGIPADMSACHVAEIGGYVVAGHVPQEAISKLLAESPAGIGIVVPGMPSKSPGMGGTQQDWQSLEVFFIGLNGEVSVFDF